MTVAIRRARLDDIPALAEIEVDAARRFREVGLDSVAQADPTDPAAVASFVRNGLAAVAVDSADRPVGFVLAAPLDAALHVHELCVTRAEGRRGVGAALLGEAEQFAIADGHRALTLSTFRDVPWNGPYYARLGFRPMEEPDWTPVLRMVRDRERAMGLPVERRMFMRKPLARSNPGLTHIGADGAARMVDVADKAVTERVAVAEGFVGMLPETLATIRAGNAKKGDVIGVARIAGIMAAKRTHELIPLCHPLALTSVAVEIEPQDAPPALRVLATVRVTGQTGVEMEALTAVSVACLTIYDMAKAIDRGMTISGVRLIEKSGGRSGSWRA